MNCNICGKCPDFLIDERNYFKGILYEGYNFVIDIPCLYPSERFKIRNNSKYTNIKNNNCDTLLQSIDSLLNWPDLQLEDAIRLTKIKSEI